MPLPNVDITLANGGLGLTATAPDRLVGLVLNGNPAEGFGPLNTPQLLSGINDPLIAGFRVAAAGSYAREMYRQIADYYKEAGEGTPLYVMTVDPAATTASVLTDQVRKLLDYADGKLNVVGISRYLTAVPGSITRMGGIDADIYNAMDEAQALGVEYATKHQPVRFVLDGRYWDGNVATAGNLRGLSFNRVCVCLASNNGAQNACIGQVLGRVTASPVNMSLGRFKSGAVLANDGWYTDGSKVGINDAKGNGLHDKGYLILRRFVGYGGVYFNGAPMATAATDDFNNLANGRVIDKALRIVYATYVQELNDTVLVDENTGFIVATTVKQYQARIETAIDRAMTGQGEISGVTAYIDPRQNMLATGRLDVVVNIVPTGVNEKISVKLGLLNPNAN